MSDPKQARSDKDMFYRDRIFPDVKSILKYQQKSVEEIKKVCLVGIDANVLLMPYQIDKVFLGEIIKIYNELNVDKRLIIPAQAAREFLSHRAEKLGNVVQYLRDEASKLAPPLKKKIGIFDDDNAFREAEKTAAQIEELTKALRSKLLDIADKLSLQVGLDPVSGAYAGLVEAVRELTLDEAQKQEFQKEVEWRYSHKVPPGYMDASNPTGGAGDLVIWKTLLEEGKAREKDLIFVTGEEKPDWWVKNHGVFQARVELLEEYRAFTGGYTVHLMPLSKLLRLFEVKSEILEAVRNVEAANTAAAAAIRATTEPEYYYFETVVSPEQAKKFAEERARLVREVLQIEQEWRESSLPLPKGLRVLRAQIQRIDQQLALAPPAASVTLSTTSPSVFIE